MGEVLIEVLPAGPLVHGEDLAPRTPSLEDFRARAVEVADGIAEVASYFQERFGRTLGRNDGQGLGPDQIEISFGADVRAEANLVIARASGGCTFAVKLTWMSRPEQAH
jgi:hypothetical protein